MGRDLVKFRDAILQEMPSAVEGRPTEACIGPISYKDDGAIARDCENLKAAISNVAVEEAFVTAVAPASTAYDGVDEYYHDERKYIFAMQRPCAMNIRRSTSQACCFRSTTRCWRITTIISSSRAPSAIANGLNCASRRSIMRLKAFRKIAFAITSALAHGIYRTRPTRRLKTSSSIS